MFTTSSLINYSPTTAMAACLYLNVHLLAYQKTFFRIQFVAFAIMSTDRIYRNKYSDRYVSFPFTACAIQFSVLHFASPQSHGSLFHVFCWCFSRENQIADDIYYISVFLYDSKIISRTNGDWASLS